MQVEKKTLKNGLKTLFINAPGNTSGSVQIWFRAGSSLENVDNQGIAHFLEHMFFKGTQKRPGAMIAHEVESFGGEINAFTSFDYTCYYINTPVGHVKQTVDILLDMVANPSFKEEDIIPERGVVFEEYRRSQDNPHQYSFQRLQKNSFTGGYAHPILGREDTIKNFSRTQLIEFRESHYNLANAFLLVACDLQNENVKNELIKKIESFSLPNGTETTIPRFGLKNKSTIDVHCKDVKMAQLTFTVEAPEFNNPKSSFEDLAFNCLGHGETSRLYKSLVLDGSLANSTSASTMFMADGAVHFIKINFPTENLNKILAKIKAVFLELSKDGFSKEEVQKIKNQYVASKIYDKESIESFSFSIGYSYAQTKNEHSEDEFIERIKKSKTSQVNGVFRDVLARPIHYSLQIPNGIKKSECLKSIKNFQNEMAKMKPAKNNLNKALFKKSQYDSQIKIAEIKQGITLLYRQNNMTPTFVLHSYLKGGLTEESEKTNGVYHLISSLLSKGYKGHGHDKLSVELEGLSASLSGFTGKNAYGLTLHGQTEHFPTLLDHFTGSLLTPTFLNKKLTHEKELTYRSLLGQQTDPVRQCFRQVNEAFFKGHPYSQNILGSPESLKGINKNLVEKIHFASIQKSELLFSYCGDLEFEDVYQALKQKLNGLKSRPSKKVKIKEKKPQLGKTIKIPFDREQTNIFYGIPCSHMASKENIVLKMITAHLSGQSSELFVEVRDRQGLCYSAQPIHFNALEGGYWGIYMASGHDKVEKALEAIKKIVDSIAHNGISKELFERVKTMIEGQVQISVQTNEDYANIYSVPMLQGKGVDYYHKTNKAVADLSYEHFLADIKKIFARKWSTILVGKNL